MAWVSAGPLVNPAIDTILADTGAIVSGGGGNLQMIVASTVACVVVLERRNALNTANISSQIFPVAAADPYDLKIVVGWADGERFRLRLNAAITGSAQASLITD